ncbi:fibrillin-1-like [Macrobrachium nipponense]|uniref:fibrillin-1-like n=1 Tax=Macrobrachium nipponense TaxID=159736 RepID=UPI0030C7D0F2
MRHSQIRKPVKPDLGVMMNRNMLCNGSNSNSVGKINAGETEHVEGKLQELRFEMEHLKGIHQETKDCLGREDLEHFKNISLAGQRELESFLHQEISGVISLLETDECSEGSHNCGDYEACTDKLVGFTCYCTEGFSRNGSHCEDIDECAQGKAECSPQATCKNSVGSYSCSCNPPFEGDGRTCEFSCEPSGKVYEGLGCIKAVYEALTWHQMNATCQEAGWRFAQDIKIRNEKDVDRAFPYGGWVGVYEGNWLESGLPLQEDLWEEGHRPTDPARRCGYIMWNFSSPHLYTVNQYKCSDTALGYCQYVL